MQSFSCTTVIRDTSKQFISDDTQMKELTAKCMETSEGVFIVKICDMMVGFLHYFQLTQSLAVLHFVDVGLNVAELNICH